MRIEPVPLAEGFEAADEARWRALVDKALKGRPADSLVSRTADGVEIRPLYTRADAGPVLGPRPGPSDDPDRPWDLRALVEHPGPARANALALQELEGGAASLLLRLDPAARDGIAAASQDDLARVLEGVYLELAPVALDAGFLGPEAANWLAVAAKGSPNARLAFHMDPISAFAETGASPGPMALHLNAAAQSAARHAGAYPRMTAFLASGRAVHEAGGSEAQELGLMAASAAAYARAMVDEEGLAPADAFGRIVLGLSANKDYFADIAKLRAARAIWARLCAVAGVDVPARIEARTSRRMLSKRDPWVNLLRQTAAVFGAGVGGADAVVAEPFTRPLGLASDLARRQARNIQLVLMEEAALGRVADPAGGAWFLEALTDQLAREGWAAFQAIEAEGGAVAALQAGRLQAEVARVRAEREAAIAEKRRPLLGVTVFPDAHEKPVPVEAVDRAGLARDVDLSQPGPDDRCEPLTPIRWSAPYEEAQS